MRRFGRVLSVARAAIGCAALYALVLQALLAAALPHPAFAAAGEILCAHDAGAPEGRQAPDHGHRACCVLACAAALPAATPEVAAVAWPAAMDAAPARPWAEAGRLARPPPHHHVSPRGPPAA